MNDDATSLTNSRLAPRERFSPVLLLSLMVCIFLFGALFGTSYSVMWEWWQRDDYNHCFFVPLITLYLLWEKRVSLRTIPVESTWPGIAPFAFGIALYWLGELGGEFYTLYLASWFIFAGFCWLLMGWRRLKAAAFPLVFLIGMFPFPNVINNNLTFRLKLISSHLGVAMLQWLGMSAYREGNVIDLGFTRLQVVDACSGLRFFLPLIVLAALLAYFFRAAWWKRLVLIVIAVPLSIVMNSLRIASVGVLYQFFGAQVADGFFHDFSGWFIFMVSFAVLLGCMWLMKKTPPERRRAERFAPGMATEGAGMAISFRHPLSSQQPFALIIPMVLLGATLFAINHIDFREKVPLRSPFSAFPLELADWRGSRETMGKEYLDELGLSDYIIADFRDMHGKHVNFYTAYNESQRKGKSSHSPDSCLPGNGWSFEESGRASISLSDGHTIEVKRAIISKNGQRQLSYYWFPQRGRILHNLFELKLYAFWDAITKHRTDGALVRLIAPVDDHESLQQAEGRLQAFTRTVIPVLNRFLPGKELQ